MPVTAVAGIYDDYNAVYPASTLIDSDDYVVLPPDSTNGIVRLKNHSFNRSENVPNIKITYTAGYTVSTLPNDMKEAILKIASSKYRRAKGGVNSADGDQEDIAKSWMTEATETLTGYKRIV
jgi:hypothetical protein